MGCIEYEDGCGECGVDIRDCSENRSGCYDLNGRCINCGKFHPCDCEIEIFPKEKLE